MIEGLCQLIASFGPEATIQDLLNYAAKYVPYVRDAKWEVLCGAEVFGRLDPGSLRKYIITEERTSGLVSELAKYEVFCSEDSSC